MNKKYTNPEIPDAVWTIRDLIIVTLSIFAGGILFYISTFVLFGDSKTTFRLARYVGSLLMIIIPIVWLRKKLRLPKEFLGLRKGNLSLLSDLLIGLVAAIIYLLLVQLTPFKYIATPISLTKTYSVFHLIFLPLSISGFATIVLAPVSEEIMIRGFIYGYFRKKLGVIFGIFAQALLFSLLHLNVYDGNAATVVVRTFIIGLILGLLYERTGSLYASIICHSVINYLSIIILVLQR